MEDKKFNVVFAKLELSETIRDKFEHCVVTAITINENDKMINITLMSDNIINIRYIDIFKEQMEQNFDFIETIIIDLKFGFSGKSLENKISYLWKNILYKTNYISPLCNNILSQANWELTNNNLTINVKNNSSFFFSKKSIHKEIENYINSCLDENVLVNIKNIPITKLERIENESIFLKNEISMLSNYKNIVVSTDATIKRTNINKTQVENPYKKKSFGRSVVKINRKLLDRFNLDNIKMSENLLVGNDILIAGEIFEIEQRETKSGKFLITFDITDKTDSLTIKFFIEPEDFIGEIKSLIKKGSNVIVSGKIQNDDYSKELNIMAQEFCPLEVKNIRMDNSKEKRVELHLHTKMSSMDGISTVKNLVERAASWGHKAVAITDHGVVQAFPDAMNAAKGKDIKIIYGVEAYLIDDLAAIVECPNNQSINCDYVVFDLETTGLSPTSDKIIEIGAVKISDGKIIDEFAAYINPYVKLPTKIIELTGITDDMLKDAENLEDVLPRFLEFISDNVLVAHNAPFDMGFLRNACFICNGNNFELNNTTIDTVELSRTLLPDLKRHKLNLIAEYLDISLENHHRATDDAKATAEIFLHFKKMLEQLNIDNLNEINVLGAHRTDKSKLKSYHTIILVKNKVGLRNLYELVSLSHLNYFYRRPLIPKSELIRLREGLLIGTACEAGEFYRAIFLKKPKAVIRELANFYDYFEIQPKDNNMFLFRNGNISNIEELININKKIVSLGEEFKKPVVATCDVHFLEPDDDIYRKVVMYAEGFKDADVQAPLYYRTTQEMLDEFNYLGEKKTHEVVIENTNLIADMIENIKPIPDETFPPFIEGAESEVENISLNKAKEIYGEPLPPTVLQRLEKELDSIIKNGFSVMYIIAQKLVWKSLEDGYLVGSRGSVGSSFVATMLSITEVNPLAPHYICSKCKYSDFDSDIVKSFAGASGCDMPDKFCPVCGSSLNKEGHDIPFETFLGFNGDKEPDIDLNFSGEYQSKAHAYTEELFGKGFVFKAGTIGTIAEKTAYGFVKKYFDERGIYARNAEVNRLKNGCTGIKRTTGQHPGGLMIVPDGHSIYEFSPIQRPANDTKSNITTTHFDYHSIEGRLLKLDLLGHDVPTIIRYLHDTTGYDPTKVELGDKKIISLFTSPEELGVSADDINCKTGSLGLPEFGTSFVRQMLLDTQPKTFAELVRISGLSHGTDVWFNNAQDLIKEGTATLKEVIPTRDDIMVFLINKGVEDLAAFKIMENVRKGKGVTTDEEIIMRSANVPDWYIESCRRIKYMFPKGHAVAYVMMTVRIGYFKINYPYSFYGATFSVKSEDFDYEMMCQGTERVKQEIQTIQSLGKDATAKEKNNLTVMELVFEMYARGLKFLPLDLYESDAKKFVVTKDGLLPPLSSIQGLGINAAEGIVNARTDGEFQTIEEFQTRTKTTKTVTSLLKRLNILKGIPETNQLSLF